MIRTLLLSTAAKVILGVILALGVVTFVGSLVAAALFAESETAERLEESYVALSVESQRWARETQRCAISGGIACLHEANDQLAAAFRRFQSELRDLEYPGFAIDEAERLDRDVTDIILVLERMSATNEPARYDELLAEYQSLAFTFDADFEALLDEVRF
jgi:hypothetical protein